MLEHRLRHWNLLLEHVRKTTLLCVLNEKFAVASLKAAFNLDNCNVAGHQNAEWMERNMRTSRLHNNNDYTYYALNR
eukprot:749421-Hanusia_phi.AAC.2